MPSEFEKPYDPKTVEPEIYKKWEESGFFNPDKLSSKKSKPFTIIMPPPNANGALHIGHAVFVTLQDIMTRYQRMRGKKALWLPGADHAGFETQVVYDKKLEKEGRSRFKIPRDELWKEMWDFTEENKKVMENQLRKLGASCDWSREKFTLNPDIIETVYDTFKKLYDDGLAYRDNRIVNWCTKHQTTLSDVEVKYIEKKDPLYYIKYGPVTLATVRLETKFGDTAVAVHPKDKRYKNLIGKEIEIKTLLGPTKIKVIGDEIVDPEFGTGVVKVTPAHDPNDFEIWKKHKDEIPGPRSVIDQYGRMDLSAFIDRENAKKYHGLKVMEARKLIEEDMQKEGLMEKIDQEYTHTVATCYKCGAILEPRILPQWFIAMTKPIGKTKKSLRDLGVETVKKGEIKFLPSRMEKIYMHWMKNLRDWNISRQIVWGIRIPAWYRGKEIYVGKENPSGEGWEQDRDVFDTWFSSGQWPFAALGYPGSKDFKNFYPTDVMETGWDILFFWVARMVMLGKYRTGKMPFRTIYLHGLVRDKDRQKMSKSKGNVIDPLGVSELYGTDAVRMALIIGNTPGNDVVISEEKIRGYRNFANKIWNASRFVITHTKTPPEKNKVKYASKDKEMLKKLSNTSKDVTKHMEQCRFYQAAETLYHFFWHFYADKVIEEMKERLTFEDGTAEKETAKALLLEFHFTLMKLLHPFMPFITERVWQELNLNNRTLLMIETWPQP
ncbi:valine--tRNA ligase [Candidatus Giovannonibacteria bacterium]|nr:valine--tRNA ligase [Candidatus Giovannonibacteria bacterium]